MIPVRLTEKKNPETTTTTISGFQFIVGRETGLTTIESRRMCFRITVLCLISAPGAFEITNKSLLLFTAFLQ